MSTSGQPVSPRGGERIPSDRRESDGGFTTTHWSLVLAAGAGGSEAAEAALQTLLRTYWYPVYGFVRRRGRSPEDAEDLTQGFFEHLLAHRALQVADPRRGRFRSFLLAAVKNHLANDWDRRHAAKRGRGVPTLPIDRLEARHRFAAEATAPDPPDVLFERSWGLALLEQVQTRFRRELSDAGHADRLEWLESAIAGDQDLPTQEQIARRTGLSLAAVKSEIHRARIRFRRLLRREIARTVASPEDIDDEIRHLRSILSH